MRNISLIIGREYRERVFKKSFLITTIVMPLLMILMGAAPTLIMEFAEGDTRHISVVDESGLVAPRLISDDEVVFTVSTSDLATTLVEASQNEENFGETVTHMIGSVRYDKDGKLEGYVTYGTNTGDEDAHIQITLIYTDKEPVKVPVITVGARRVRCLRTNVEADFGPYTANFEEQYAIMLESDVPVVAQYGRAEPRTVAFYTTPGYCE